MARKPRYDLGPRRETYVQATHRPLNCLIFLLPLIVAYEVGSMTAGPLPLEGPHIDQRVIAFYWIVRFLGLFTAVPTYLPGVLLVLILLLWHFATDGRIRLRWQTFAGMAGESVLFCLPLLVLYRMVQVYLAGAAGAGAAGGAELPPGLGDRLIIDLTAGIYEEVIFRLLLIWMFQLLLIDVLDLPASASMAAILIITGILFSGYHYLGAESFQWRSFLFRAAAGIFLGAIYVLRGFGIAVGTHSLYDVVISLLA